MSPDSQPEGKPARPGPVRMCARCDTLTHQPVLVAEVHANSGPGWNVYACRACAPLYPKQPDPLVLMDLFARNRDALEGGQ